MEEAKIRKGVSQRRYLNLFIEKRILENKGVEIGYENAII